MLSAVTDNPEMLIALMAALSVFSAILVVSWPYLVRDNLEVRMRSVASERERIRARERARLEAEKKTSLRTEPKKLFQDIVDRFNLSRQAESGEMARMLRMAGYRGRGPVVTFLAMRMLMPLVMLIVAGFYVFLVIHLEQPFFVKLAIVLAVTFLGYYLPQLYVKNKISKRQLAVKRAWPDALDLLLICVESGMGIESAFRKVSEEIGVQSIELAEELSLTTAELSYLQDRRRAYENLGERTGLEGVRAVVTSLIQAEKYGTPLGQSLRILAQENRDMRMAEAEKKAASLPPKLTVPMIIFFLPVLFAVIITPAAIQVTKIM
ncbi:type II secretion system F family protein [Propylenella binzhouense]|uniref:Type II secretion system F family protein n=1 Tax=Propylenella binzhouense TaxID=2555902 RepID=A0A964T531_9HYPH|nr:type II secretion system F family protein [Propylenella binzhouense]MYZ48668.1 type II secretion system F family protein [Propylenella binzhouense]